MSKLALDQSVASAKSNESARLVRDDLGALPTSVTEQVMAGISETMRDIHTSHSVLLTQVMESSIQTAQLTKEIKGAVLSLLGSSDSSFSPIAVLLQPALEKAISDRISSEMQTLLTKMEIARFAPEYLGSKDSAQLTITRPHELETGIRGFTPLSYTKTCSRWAGKSKTIKFWFGRLHISTTSLQRWQGHGRLESLQRTEYLETKVTLIPATWLLRTGVIFKITRLISAVSSPPI